MAASNWVESNQVESKPFTQYRLERTVKPLNNFVISSTGEYVAFRLAEEEDHVLIFDSAQMKEVGQLKNQNLVAACPIPNQRQFATLSRKGLIQIWDFPTGPGEQKASSTLTSLVPIDNLNDEPQLIAAELKDNDYLLVAVRNDRDGNIVINRLDCKNDKLLEPITVTKGKYSISHHLLCSQFLTIGINDQIVLCDLKSEKKAVKKFDFLLENHHRPEERIPFVSRDGKQLTVVDLKWNGAYYSISKWEFNNVRQGFYPTSYNTLPFNSTGMYLGFMHGEVVARRRFAAPDKFFSIDPYRHNSNTVLGVGNFVFEHPQGIAIYDRDRSVSVHETNSIKSIEEISRHTSQILEEKAKLPKPLQKLICRLAFFDASVERPYLKKLDGCIQQLKKASDKLSKQFNELNKKNFLQRLGLGTPKIENIKLDLYHITEMLEGLKFLEFHLENSPGSYHQYLREMLIQFPIWEKISRENWRPTCANEINQEVFEFPFSIALFEKIRLGRPLGAT